MLSDTSPGQAEAQKNAAIHAKKMRAIARIKTIQRTPYPMVLARIKLLLDKLHVRMRFLLFMHQNVHGCSFRGQLNATEIPQHKCSGPTENKRRCIDPLCKRHKRIICCQVSSNDNLSRLIFLADAPKGTRISSKLSKIPGSCPDGCGK